MYRLLWFVPRISKRIFLPLSLLGILFLVFMSAVLHVRRDWHSPSFSKRRIAATLTRLVHHQSVSPIILSELKKILLPNRNTDVAKNESNPQNNTGSSSSRLTAVQLSVENLRVLVNLLNSAQVIHNEDIFGIFADST
ncbi:unnamed protein product, partial [Notodromas monacha]